MIAWKLAISPATASNANTFAALDPKIARNHSRIGSPDVPRAKAPWTILVAPAASVTCRSIGIEGLIRRTRKPRADQREHSTHDPLRHIAFRVCRFFCCKRKLLDG